MEWKNVISNIFWMFVVLFVIMTNPICHRKETYLKGLDFLFYFFLGSCTHLFYFVPLYYSFF